MYYIINITCLYEEPFPVCICQEGEFRMDLVSSSIRCVAQDSVAQTLDHRCMLQLLYIELSLFISGSGGGGAFQMDRHTVFRIRK